LEERMKLMRMRRLLLKFRRENFEMLRISVDHHYLAQYIHFPLWNNYIEENSKFIFFEMTLLFDFNFIAVRA
jgi:hypothetical protein